MKRVLLVRTYKDVGAGGAVPPLGLLYVAAALRKAFPGGCEVRLLDAGLEKDPGAAVAAAAADFRPDLAGFSALSCEAGFAHSLAAAVRRASPSVFVLFGGPYATVSAAKALEDPAVDACVLGEGELTAPELAAAVFAGKSPAGLPGTAVRSASGPVFGPPRPPVERLDSLAWPAWDLADLARYSRLPNWNGYLKRSPYAPLLTTRGCPFSCVYCHNLFGKRLRARSAADAVAEAERLRLERGVREFHIVDDVFNYDRARALEFCALAAEKLKGCSFSFPNGLRADLLDRELAAALKRMGTYKVHFGVESASARVRGAMRKDLSLESVSRAVELASAAGITTAGYFMLGFPGETAEEMRETADYAASSGLDAAYFFRVTPYPGTPLYDSLPPAERPPEDGAFFSAGASDSPRGREVAAAMLYAQRRFYLSPSRLWRLLRRSHNPAGFLRTLPSFLAGLLAVVIAGALVPGASVRTPQDRGRP